MQTPIESESDILPWALANAQRSGDPNPTLIQHTRGTRAAAAAALGWGTVEQTPVYVVAMQGQFLVVKATIHRSEATKITVPVLFRVIDMNTSRVIDSGARDDYPDLTSIGPVITDLDIRATQTSGSEIQS